MVKLPDCYYCHKTWGNWGQRSRR